MLPGFRFLFAAIVLSMSILVFGLGAAALLRAAHEEFASNPTWRAAPETVFAQPAETSRPVLAMLRVEPPASDPKAPENIPANIPADIPALAPPAEPVPTVSAPPEPAASTSTPADEPQQVAALTPEASSPPKPAKPEIPVAEPAAASNAAPAQAEKPAPEHATAVPAPAEETAVPAPAEETKTASSEVASSEQVVPPTTETAPALSDPISPPMTPEATIAATRIATLGGPPVPIGAPSAKLSSARPEPHKGAIKKHEQARRAAKHRKLAARARIAQQATPLDPFALPIATTPARKR